MIIGEVVAQVCGWLVEGVFHGVLCSHWRLWLPFGLGIVGGLVVLSVLGGAVGFVGCLICCGAGLFLGLKRKVGKERGRD